MSTKKIFSLVVFINIFFIIAALFLFVTIRTKNRSISSKQNSIESILKADDQLVVLQSSLEETKKDRAKLETFLVDKETIATFLEYIEALGKTAGVKASVASLSEDTRFPVSGSEVPVLRLVLNASGSWQAVYRYLNLLQNLPYREEISSVTLRNETGATYGADGKVIDAKKNHTWNGTFELAILKNN